MDMNKYDEEFIKKYHDDAEDNNYLYEYKTGEFQGGEIIGMQSIPQISMLKENLGLSLHRLENLLGKSIIVKLTFSSLFAIIAN